ncbi:Enoyl-CoA hydratase [Rhodovastum atsumiense]|uniref:Enoyl-CoA hydratase n=1 Tax=Rhodovastum atsumiense TaxID=504468 RepID=A0A5M6IPX7_9PROT|nr:enoyl-CoA hydratase-related protein [Rhodovastum atsumiense]KAA5609535.1 enoyl-CoA hydratase [Rhodovastum atsumiense]CAH2604936.1 Enoyl-CoA hydratase [Rhodovastum atsumiense]
MRDHVEGRILAETVDGVGLITFARPAKHNAMTIGMWDGLAQILDDFARDDGVRVVVLTGAGPTAFVAGADPDPDLLHGEAMRLAACAWARLAGFPRPTIARIRGACLDAGLGIALHCDLRIAAIDSDFGFPGPAAELAEDGAMIRQLVSVVGPAHARMLLTTGQRIAAAEAQRIGLVNRVVADEDLSDTVVDLARSIADRCPQAMAALKRAVTEALQGPAASRAAFPASAATL